MQQSRQSQHPQQGTGWMCWLPLLLALFCTSVPAAPLIKLNKEFSQADLTNFADLLIDPTQQLTIAQITRAPAADSFAPAKLTSLQHIDRHGVYWLRFGVDNPLREARMLALNLRTPNKVAIAAFSATLQSSQPLLLQRTPLLQLVIPAQSKQLYYLRIGPGAIETSQFELLSLERYLASYRTQAWLNGVLLGSIMLIAIAAAFTGSLRRDSAYWWLAGHCLALTLYQFFYRADLNPLTFDYASNWQYRHQLLQTSLLLSSICSIRLAQCLPITASREGAIKWYGAHPLTLLLAGTVLTLPAPFLLPPLTSTTWVLGLTTLTVAITAAIALYNFLLLHRRELLFYALARMSILIIGLGGDLAWNANSTMRELTNDTLAIAIAIEAIALFSILIWRSFEQQRLHARSERDIAVLEAEARSQTEVVADIGHRVRTPISGVLGMLDMLQDTTLSATQSDYLNTIRRASNELLNVVDEISDVSRLQMHAAQLQQNIFDPHVLVTECVDGFRSAAAAHHLELINDLAPELPTYVSGDVTRLRQIILQLLHQAISQRERGEIVLRVRQLPQSDQLRFEIRTRAAIAATVPSEIDRRVNPPGSANVRFAIAQQLIDMLGGHMHIEKVAEGNLHAWFDLPLPTIERDGHSGDLSSNSRDTRLQGKQLLVVDDSPTFCDVLQRQLNHWGITVFVAHSVSEGLARLRNQVTVSQPIDVLLIDADLPELNQGEWPQRLSSEIDPAPILILLSSEPDSGAGAKPFDMRRVLLKPINHTSLKITLIEAFKQREQRPLLAPSTRHQPIRCLFAEDNLINAKVLAVMLDKLGVVYTATSNGQEAVDACRRDRFDIVLMDGDMPVMDGWEASRRIREIFEDRGETIPIIALTANTVEELGERARQLVMDAHLVKPIRLQSLRELLEQWTGKILSPSSDLSN